MTTQVFTPNRKDNNGLSKLVDLGKTIGGLAGMAHGNPAGAKMAAQGGMGLAASNGGNQIQHAPQPADSSAMSRRMDATGDEGGFMGQLAALRDGEQALNELPHEVRQEYTKPLFNTIMAAHKDYMDRLARGEKLS